MNRIEEIDPCLLEVDEDFHSIWGDLDAETYNALKADIEKDGMHDPIAFWHYRQKYLIVDGHNRYRISRELNLDFVPVIKLEFKDKAEAATWIVSHQQNRRNVTDWQKAKAGDVLRKVIEAEAKKRQQAAGGDRKSEDYQKSVRENSPKAIDTHEEDRTRHKVAEATGLTDWKVRQADYVKAHADEDQIASLDSGERTLKEVYKEVKRDNAPPTIEEQVAKRHEETQKKDVVSIEEAKRDKDDVEFLKNQKGLDDYIKILKATKGITAIQIFMKKEDIENVVEVHDKDSLDDLKTSLVMARNVLDSVLMELAERREAHGKT